MNDSELGKKMVEESELEPFLEEYEYVTGNRMKIVNRSERPDFHCRLEDRTDVGVELVKLIQDPQTRLWREIIHYDSLMDTMDASIAIQELIYKKEKKRKSQGWAFPSHTILVVQLIDAEADQLKDYFDDVVFEELCATGFMEIWLADYTIIDPYSTVQLFGIKPDRWRGLHPHLWSGTKPWG